MIKTNKKVNVFNVSTGSVSFKLESGARIRWDKPDISKEIDFKDLQALVNADGGHDLLTTTLLVKDENVRQELGLPTGEYAVIDSAKALQFVKGDVLKLEDLLIHCTDGIKQLIAKVASENKIDNLSTIKVIKEYTGQDLVEIYKRLSEEKEINTKSTSRVSSVDAEKKKSTTKTTKNGRVTEV